MACSSARFFASLGRWLIVEFVPKGDPKTDQLLSSRLDIFTHYTQEGFEESFSALFTIKKTVPIRDSSRVLYLMEKK